MTLIKYIFLEFGYHPTHHNIYHSFSDSTFTNENVSAVLASVPTYDLPSVLWIPESRKKQIQTLSHSKTDERIGFINYFLECSVLAEWSSLTGLLYFSQQFDSLEAAKKFISTTRGIILSYNMTSTAK